MTALFLLVALVQQSNASEVFERGKIAYERGEYARAISILRPLLYPEIRLQYEGEVVQTHRMLGIAHLYEKQTELAAQEFRKLLQLRPDFRFDTLLDEPQVVEFFNTVLRQHEAELEELEAKRREIELAQQREREELERARNGPVVVERRYVRNSFAVNFIPFGAGQFQNGQRGKGWAFLLGQSALGAISVGAFATNFALHGTNPRRSCTVRNGGAEPVCDRTAQDRSEMLTRVQVVSGALFFGVAAWGIVDAILNFQPEIPLQARVAPLLLDGGLGAGFAFRF